MVQWSLWFRLTIAILATWRVAHLVAHEDGPFDVVVRVRARAGSGVLGDLMDCPYCLSLWIAVPFAFSFAHDAFALCAASLAISGGASLLERLAERHPSRPPVTGVESDVLLRSETLPLEHAGGGAASLLQRHVELRHEATAVRQGR
jgi:uncharacterized protein DUF1360